MSHLMPYLVVLALLASAGFLGRNRLGLLIETHLPSVTGRPQRVATTVLVARGAAACATAQRITMDSLPWYPTQLTLAMNPVDVARFVGGAQAAAEAVLSMLVRKARHGNVELPADLMLKVVPDPRATLGRPHLIPEHRRLRVAEGASLIDLPPERISVARNPPAPSTPDGTTHCSEGCSACRRTEVIRTDYETAGTVPVDDEDDFVKGSPPTADPFDRGRTQPLVVIELLEVGLGASSYEDPVSNDLTGRTAPWVVGRDRKGSDLWVSWSKASRHHFEILTLGPVRHVLRDLGSLNGTYVNGQQVEETELKHNDEIQMGTAGPRFVFSRLSTDLPVGSEIKKTATEDDTFEVDAT